MFDEKTKAKKDKSSARSKSVDSRSNNTYAWVKKIKSKKFNRPDIVTVELLLQVLRAEVKE